MTFLEVASMVLTWWIVPLASVYYYSRDCCLPLIHLICFPGCLPCRFLSSFLGCFSCLPCSFAVRLVCVYCASVQGLHWPKVVEHLVLGFTCLWCQNTTHGIDLYNTKGMCIVDIYSPYDLNLVCRLLIGCHASCQPAMSWDGIRSHDFVDTRHTSLTHHHII